MSYRIEPIEFDDRAPVGISPFNVSDPQNWPGSVLLADEIERYSCSDPPMIDPFRADSLRPASYSLHLGNKIRVEGETKILDNIRGHTLKPQDVVVVSTREHLRIPRFLIARWSLRVTNIYQGLLWTGGPQVDPGWSGVLHCPIYNLSKEDVNIRYDDPFFTMDFVRTTAISSRYMRLKERDATKKVWFDSSPREIEDNDRFGIVSAPAATERKMQELEIRMTQSLNDIRRLGVTFVTIMLTAIAALVAALSVVAVRPVAPPGDLLEPWPLTAIGMSLFATVIALLLAGKRVLDSIKGLKSITTRTKKAEPIPGEDSAST